MSAKPPTTKLPRPDVFDAQGKSLPVPEVDLGYTSSVDIEPSQNQRKALINIDKKKLLCIIRSCN
jgi:hypothetical protein